MSDMITLSNKIMITKKYSGKSKFDFWKNLKAGDVINISIILKPTGRGSSGIYVPTIKFENKFGNDYFSASFNEACNYLNKVEYENLDN